MPVDETVQNSLDMLGTSAADAETIQNLNRSVELKNNQIADLQEKLAKANDDLAQAQSDLADTRNAVNEAVGKLQAQQQAATVEQVDPPAPDNQQTLAGFPAGGEPQ